MDIRLEPQQPQQAQQAQQAQQGDALSEGRRIYLGNLLYSVKPGDVEDLVRQAGFEQSFEKLHISVDPVSGRNPGYCFVEFATRDEAERALDVLPGALLFNRPIKVGPCHPKTPSQSRWGAGVSRGGAEYTPTFQRWGDWKGASGGEDQQQQEQGPDGAIRHLDARRSRPREKAQLYIGGLGKMIDQEHHEAEMQEILAGYEYVAIGKRITPRAETRETPGNHHYCFVDFSSAEEAERALSALHGKPVEGGNLRVSYPRSKGPAFESPEGGSSGWRSPGDRSRGAGGASGYQPGGAGGRRQGTPRQDGQQQQQQDGAEAQQQDRRDRVERQRAIMASNNWRTGGGTN